MKFQWRPFKSNPAPGQSSGVQWRKPGVLDTFDPLLTWADARAYSDHLRDKTGRIRVLVETKPDQHAALARLISDGVLVVAPAYQTDLKQAAINRFPAAIEPQHLPNLAQCATHVSAALIEDALDRLDLTRLPGSLPGSISPCAVRQIAGSLPLTRTSKAPVSIGVIDFGCPFLREDLCVTIKGQRVSRVKALWDQGSAPAVRPWRGLEDFGYGRELDEVALSALAAKLGAHSKDQETAAYERIGCASLLAGDLAAHGGEVLGLLAGADISGDAAASADLYFVDLPHAAVEDLSGHWLDAHLLDGLHWLISRAAKNIPLVVNISFGAYHGPHDGHSTLECAIDELVRRHKGWLSVIVASGNSADIDNARCVEVSRAQPQSLRLQVPAGNPLNSRMEIWYPAAGAAQLKLQITPPSPLPPCSPALQSVQELRFGAETVALAAHGTRVLEGVKYGYVQLAIAPTQQRSQLCGEWLLTLKSATAKPLVVHAWIDRSGARDGSASLQSGFADDAEEPAVAYSLTNLSTAREVISVGAFYEGDSRYALPESGRGPSRDGAPTPSFSAAGGHSYDLGLSVRGVFSGQKLRAFGTSLAAPNAARCIAEIQAAQPTGQWLTKVALIKRLSAGAAHDPSFGYARLVTSGTGAL